ncbi:hypothetical protein RSOLAG1IB_08685 [Rhizoctonia solani AG-1 IB]|uniref:SET domain-containing protein n=1 Tax=Thanatephorus cucumeris (strain AG1-IB / isolate 7/3/14) TaxID=1108050 RepID=A0A0B7FNY8_THACB|nr:hypothetical protein RSOLAG1IB_08685 [Rhizoctonia solani AG-1 IB]
MLTSLTSNLTLNHSHDHARSIFHNLPQTSNMSILPRESLLEYPNLCTVNSQPGFFMSGLQSLATFEPGQLITHLTGLTKSPEKTWSSVQCGVEDHIELNSVFVFMNHSCAPTAIIDLGSPNRSEWHIRALQKINPGDELTFFYPSTEWDSPQPFDCRCQAQNCIGYYRGSKYLSRQEVENRGYISPWVLHLMHERDASGLEQILRVGV